MTATSDPMYDWIRDACAIVGIGATEYSKASGVSVTALAAEAAGRAVVDAGIDVGEIDGIVRNNYDEVSAPALADSLGLDDLGYWGETGTGGAAPCAMVGQAVAAIRSGQARTVLVFRSLNGRSGRRLGKGLPASDSIGGKGATIEFFAPYGLTSPGQYFALVARRHMIEHGLTQRALGEIALTCRRRANANPDAQMFERTLSYDEYLDARMISDPLRLFDFCLETDGAAAVIVTSTPRARDLPNRPALIRSVAQATGPRVGPGQMYPALLRERLTEMPSRWAAPRLFGRAGLGPEDVDVAQLYDCFTITVLQQIEDYGFAAPGEGGPFVESGNIDLDGQLPLNTAGGQLSEGYIHGMNHILEGVRQIRGTSTNQVPDAEVSLVTSAPPPGTSALLLVAP